MPPIRTSGVSSLHEARLALGKRLRELRRQADLSGRELAEALRWPPSKVSKLENGRQSPTDDDIRAWAEATSTTRDTDRFWPRSTGFSGSPSASGRSGQGPRPGAREANCLGRIARLQIHPGEALRRRGLERTP